MDSSIHELHSRRAWLALAETDLAERLERSFASHDGARHPNDPLYQRLWFARKRVRAELSRVDAAIGAHTNYAA